MTSDASCRPAGRDATPSHRRRRLARATSVGALCLGTLLPSAAVATSGPDPLWYVQELALDEVHRTATGEGITVAVIDTPIDPDLTEFEGADLVVHEPRFCDCDKDGTPDPAVAKDYEATHGTSMTALILGNGRGTGREQGIRGVAPGARVIHYVASFNQGAAPGGDDLDQTLRQAVADGAQIVNMSFGYAGSADPEVPEAMLEAMRAGVVLVAPAGNDEAFEGFPGTGNGVVTTTHFGPDGEMVDGDNVPGPHVDVAAPGRDVLGFEPGPAGGYVSSDGSSNSTALVSGALAVAWSAHPDATANQMIQALVRSTPSAEGELARYDDWWGYGKLSITGMLATDPTTYPDVNPLVAEGPDQVPTAEQIRATTAAPTASPTSPAPDTDPGSGSGSASGDDDRPARDDARSWVIPAVLGSGGLALALGILAAVLSRRARSTGSRGGPSSTTTPIQEGRSRG